ncbi:MAG: hypothetical protein FJ319_00270 [SAR202 cluster bacterium]|nr:hypothetical protein [SAR202 cluster bacterium]
MTTRMRYPRLVYYNDAHHFHAKRLDPPVSLRKLHQPVDEVLGTGVELLVLGLGYGDVYFHQSKVGRVTGQGQEVWRDIIDWRIMRMVKDAAAMGTDQVREVIKRGKEKGLPVFPSLKLQDPADDSPVWLDRYGKLKMQHGKSVCLNEVEESLRDTDWCYDYSLDIVREEKLAMVREMLVDYQADGIELDFVFRPRYFRKAEVEKNTPLMSRFVAQVKAIANEVGAKQGRAVPVCARVFHRRDENLKWGMDAETWLKEGSVDYIVGNTPYSVFDTGIKEGQWLADAANAAGAAAYLRPPRRAYDERSLIPHIEMFRALSQTLAWQGFAGLYLGYLPWPLAEAEYAVLREMAHPDAQAWKAKRYVLPPDETPTYAAGPTDRQLPVTLEVGKRRKLSIWVADDIADAKANGEMRRPVLTIWFVDYCADDKVEVVFNGRNLRWEDAEIVNEGAARIPGTFPAKLKDKPGYNAHWFQYKLEMDDLKRGENSLEVELKYHEPTSGWTSRINQVEIQTRYRDFERIPSFGVERVPGTN